PAVSAPTDPATGAPTGATTGATTGAATGAGQTAAVPAASDRVRLLGVVLVGVVLVAAVVLRIVVRSDLWLDEALTVNIAALPLAEMPTALRRDGAPPLYYVLLHFWIAGFGEGDTAVRALSGVLWLATLPAMWLAGRRLGGRAAGWAVVLVFATVPYTFRYASETRMYALVMFLVAWGYLALRRALEAPTLGRLVPVAVVTAALLYTHNWTYYLLMTVGVLVLVQAWRGATPDARRGARRVAFAMAVGGLAYLPWLPTVLFQLGHTGTPWGDPQLPWSAGASFLLGFAGVSTPVHGEPFMLAVFVLVLPLLALFGVARGATHVDLDLRTRPLVRWEAVVALGVLAVGLTLSFATGTAFDGRYAAVVVPLFVLCIAMGTQVFGDPRVRVGVLVVVVALGLAGGVRNAVDQRTQAGEVAAVLRAEAEPGDVVVYCPDQLAPAVHRILGDGRGLTEVTFPALGGPERVNWVDYRERIDQTDSDAFAAGVLELAAGARIWLVTTPGYRSLEGRCEEVALALGTARPGGAQRIAPRTDDYFEVVGLVEYPAA
ncbi:MAG: hypothetical protein ACKOVH_13130, partial [Actinomycetota bacterium]